MASYMKSTCRGRRASSLEALRSPYSRADNWGKSWVGSPGRGLVRSQVRYCRGSRVGTDDED